VSRAWSEQRIGDFYVEVVLPALATRLDRAFAAGGWLGTLPPRRSLEQEDAVRVLAERCGYPPVAVERAFDVRYWGVARSPEALLPSRADLEPEL
jgi:hypothetical protein